jgi:Helix-turn-helix domain
VLHRGTTDLQRHLTARLALLAGPEGERSREHLGGLSVAFGAAIAWADRGEPGVSDGDGPEESGPGELAPCQQTLADLLAWLRRVAGLSQKQPADRLGYARSTVAGAETGHRSPGKAFWTSCDDLLAPAGQLRAAYAQLADAEVRS